MVTLTNFILAAITLLIISLKRSYGHVPVKELRRRARKGDDLAAVLYRASAYEPSLQWLLTMLVVVTASITFVSIASSYDVWLAALLVASLLWFGFLWLVKKDANRLSLFIAKILTPALVKLVRLAHPILNKLHVFIRKHRPITVHTGLWERQDLLDLLEQQTIQKDNRIESTELKIAQQVLGFSNKIVGDHMVPKSVVKSVNTTEPVGPMLLAELHDSGYSRFLVYENNPSNIVGVLLLRDLVDVKHSGTTKQHMLKDVQYIHEDQSLHDALGAMLNTKQHLFVVVNSFEEYTGIITLEDVLEQLIGIQIIDEYDSHEDVRSVAARIAEAEHKRLSHPTEDNNVIVISPDQPDNTI